MVNEDTDTDPATSRQKLEKHGRGPTSKLLVPDSWSSYSKSPRGPRIGRRGSKYEGRAMVLKHSLGRSHPSGQWVRCR